jgi:PilZ domain
MEKERRSAPRVRVNLPARWEGVLHHERATITDLSRTGCFVLTGGKVEVKELIYLEIDLHQKEPLHLWAEVVDEASDIGFALRFNSCSVEDEKRLASFIDECFRSQATKELEKG